MWPLFMEQPPCSSPLTTSWFKVKLKTHFYHSAVIRQFILMTKYSAQFPFCLSITSLLDVVFPASFSPGSHTCSVIFDNEVSEHTVRIAYITTTFQSFTVLFTALTIAILYDTRPLSHEHIFTHVNHCQTSISPAISLARWAFAHLHGLSVFMALA